MKKNVKSVKNSLKFKAQSKEGILSVRVGVKKYNLPVEARILSNEDYIFLSFPASSELYQVKDKKLSPMAAEADASAAFAALNPAKKRARKRRTVQAEVPTEVANALKKIPRGYRLGFGPDGEPRLVRTRTRAKKA
ncbi:MAG: hypothetical protein M9921_06670 [Fimbriimonadaceae bacterium]|nr:hypothetical protein [Chthonomonadaceae bacterium]MCO5296521.1 hypothetical protein [Fimbriimonadaceae bacterium]